MSIKDIPLPYKLGFQDTATINGVDLKILHDTIIKARRKCSSQLGTRQS
jgi:hypothetical protein